MAATQVRLPELRAENIGKYTDRTPNIRAAGKVSLTGGESTAACMKPKSRPESADVIKRFRASMQPGPGATRVFYSRARDPQRKWAAEMSHGISTRDPSNGEELINPNMKSLYQQMLQDKRESIYKTHIRAPLGTSHDQRPGLPSRLDSRTFTFGIPTELDIGAGGLVNPIKTYEEVERESKVGHDMYVKTHNDYDVSERMVRSYTSPKFNPNNTFGIPTPHCNDGRHVNKVLTWLNPLQKEHFVSTRVDNFRERTQPRLGKVHDPIKDTMKVAADHTFGLLFKPDEYGAGDLIHNRMPGMYLRGLDRKRGIVAAIRQHLKKMNYHNFQNLLEAFKFYDKDGSGKIDMDELREACFKFNVPLEPELLVQLMDTCDFNKDGLIDYVEFANFLNWKDKMSTGLISVPPLPDLNLINDEVTANEVTENEATANEGKANEVVDKKVVDEADLVIKSPHSNESTPRRLQKQVDRALGQHRTSSSMINAVVGGISTKAYRTNGIPTIRSDIAAPHLRRIDDRSNYGDESDAYGLLNPSIFSQHGVYEKDCLLPRQRHEIRKVFTDIGVQMTGETFEAIWKKAADTHPKGHVSVEAFRNVLDELQEEAVISKRHPLSL